MTPKKRAGKPEPWPKKKKAPKESEIPEPVRKKKAPVKAVPKRTPAKKVAAKKEASKRMAHRGIPFKKGTSKKTTVNKVPKNASAGKGYARVVAAKRIPNAAFMAAVTPSPSLAEVIGSQPRPRTEIVKKIWEYIKRNSLQDARNRRMINADSKLKAVFGGKTKISMFDLAKEVSKNVK